MKKAELRILEQGRTQSIALDSAGLAFGSLVYIPQSADVRVDMDVELDNATHAKESVRVLGEAPGPLMGTVKTDRPAVPAAQVKARKAPPAKKSRGGRHHSANRKAAASRAARR